MNFQKYLQENEKIFYIVHRHFFSILKPLIGRIFWYFIIPLLLYFGIKTLFSIYADQLINITSKIPWDNKYPWYLIGIIMFIGFIKIIHSYFNWYDDVIILTDKNLIYINWKGVFNKETIRLNYEDIQSVQVHIKGFLQNTFKYGHLEVETSNETTDTILSDAVNPSEAQSKIMDMKRYRLDQKYQVQQPSSINNSNPNV